MINQILRLLRRTGNSQRVGLVWLTWHFGECGDCCIWGCRCLFIIVIRRLLLLEGFLLKEFCLTCMTFFHTFRGREIIDTAWGRIYLITKIHSKWLLGDFCFLIFRMLAFYEGCLLLLLLLGGVKSLFVLWSLGVIYCWVADLRSRYRWGHLVTPSIWLLARGTILAQTLIMPLIRTAHAPTPWNSVIRRRRFIFMLAWACDFLLDKIVTKASRVLLQIYSGSPRFAMLDFGDEARDI